MMRVREIDCIFSEKKKMGGTVHKELLRNFMRLYRFLKPKKKTILILQLESQSNSALLE